MDGSSGWVPLPTWETWIAFLASSFGLVQLQLWQTWGNDPSNENSQFLCAFQVKQMINENKETTVTAA